MPSGGPLMIFVSAGEASGDLHAGSLIEELKKRAEVSVEAVGGRRMSEAGARIVCPMDKLSVVGLSEVILRIPSLARAYFGIRARWRRRPPDLFIPVDFPGFNLRLATAARSMGVPVMYYIAPQVWAWGSARLKALASAVDKMAVVLPFEEEFYRRRGISAEYVGHPLVDAVRPRCERRSFRERHGIGTESPLVGLFPGSRWHEVSKLLPPMIEAFKDLRRAHAECRAAIGLADTIPEEKVRRLGREVGLNAKIIAGEAYELMESSDALLVASGTVTLEAGLLAKPMVIVYKMSRLTYAVARRVVKTESIGLVNLVAGKRVVPEYLQEEVTAPALRAELESMLYDEVRRAEIVSELRGVRRALGGPGASARAAELALETARWNLS